MQLYTKWRDRRCEYVVTSSEKIQKTTMDCTHGQTWVQAPVHTSLGGSRTKHVVEHNQVRRLLGRHFSGQYWLSVAQRPAIGNVLRPAYARDSKPCTYNLAATAYSRSSED